MNTERMQLSESIESVDALLIVDVDGTLCQTKAPGQSYADVAPNLPLIEKLREYHGKGYRILLHTARNMNTFNGNVGMINRHTAPVLLEWLHRWDVPYDEIMFGKPWPRTHGFYIDDRAIRPDEFLSLDERQIQDLVGAKRDI